tara:strand:- start:391 stop:804 length:414 start_codon:yes stop_codon:yes gene_type:complete
MSQRVNIQYSVKLEELEGEVSKLVERAFSDLQRISSDKTQPENYLSMDCYEQIDRIRLELHNVDSILQDVSNIVRSYMAYKTQQMVQEAQPQQAQPNHSLESIEQMLPSGDLQQKLASFREKLENISEGVEDVSDSR